MAVSGHTDIKEVQKYCEAFGRQKKAEAAIFRLPRWGMEKNDLWSLSAGSPKMKVKLC